MTRDGFGDPHPPSSPEAAQVQDFERQTDPYAVRSAVAMRSAFEALTPDEANSKDIVLALTDPQSGALQPRLRRGEPAGLQRFAGRAVQAIFAGRDDIDMVDAFSIHTALSYRCSDIARDEGETHPEIFNSTTYFLIQFAELLAWRLPAEAIEHGPDPHAFWQAISPRITQIADTISERPEWFDAKMRTLANAIARRRHTETYIQDEPTAEVENIEEVKHRNDVLMAELMRLNRHQLTSALIDTGPTHWSIHDTLDIQAALAEMSTAAGTHIHPEKWIPTLMIAMETPAEAERGLRTAEPQTTGAYDPEDIMRICYMDAGGELFVDSAGTIPLSLVYAQHGKPGNYQLLRQFLIEQYFNLSVPASVVAQAMSVPPWASMAYRIDLLRGFPDADALDAAE